MTLTAFVERGIKALVLIENPLGLQCLQPHHFAIFAQHALGAQAGIHNDAFGLGFFNFFQRSGHFVAAFQAHDINFTRAHPQRGQRNIHHLAGGDRRHIFLGGL